MSKLIGTGADQVPTNGMIGKAAFLDEDVPVSQGMSVVQAAPTIASASTIAPSAFVTFISGTTAINTITVPHYMLATGGSFRFIPSGAFTLGTSCNISIASTATVGRVMDITYDAGTGKWYPSY